MVASQPKQRTVSTSPRAIRIVMAADDRKEHLLVLLAANEAGLAIEFTFVDDGPELLEALDLAIMLDDLPDLVLLDLDPELDERGQTLERLSEHPELVELPIVVVSPLSPTPTPTERYQPPDPYIRTRWFEPMPGSFSGLVDFVRSLARRACPVSKLATPGRRRAGRRGFDTDGLDTDGFETDGGGQPTNCSHRSREEIENEIETDIQIEIDLDRLDLD